MLNHTTLRCTLVLLTLIWSFNTHAMSSKPSTYTKTKHPIVMIGGFLAFDDILGINYFYDIPAELEKDGATVYPINVSAFNGTYVRGEQLILQLDNLRAMGKGNKFNLVGHSGGATTIRYVAEVRPDLVASVTSVHGAHKGIAISDVARRLIPEGGTIEALGFGLLNALGSAVEFLAGYKPQNFPQDTASMLKYYTTEASLEFNKSFSAGVPITDCGEGQQWVNGIAYYSWGGTRSFTNALDVLDFFFVLSEKFDKQDNDGLVNRCGGHLGKVIRDNYAHNHVDAMNHLFGLRGLTSQDPVQLYRQHANRLKGLGL